MNGGLDMGFDPVSYLLGKQAGGGGGGVTVEPLSVSENGTYTAPTGKAYSPVTVAVQPPGPAWTEFISVTATTNIAESMEVLGHVMQSGRVYNVVISKDSSAYVTNQLIALITNTKDGDVTTWPTAFYRWRTTNAAMANVSAAYDASIRVGDKYFICEV